MPAKKTSLLALNMKPYHKMITLYDIKGLPAPFKNLKIKQEAEGSIALHSSSSLTAQLTSDSVLIKRVFINLNGTEIQPHMPNGNDWGKGFFTEQIVITVAPSSPMDRVLDDPPGTNSDTVQSKSVSFNSSVSGGTFGTQGTVNMGVGMSVSEGTQTSIKNYSLFNVSSGSKLIHNIYLTSAGDGNPYDVNKVAEGLLPRIFQMNEGEKFWEGFQFWNSESVLYDEDKLRPLPQLANQNFPIVSQGTWETTSPELLESKVHFDISLKVTFLGINVVKEGTGVVAHSKRISADWKTGLEVDLSLVGVE